MASLEPDGLRNTLGPLKSDSKAGTLPPEIKGSGDSAVSKVADDGGTKMKWINPWTRKGRQDEPVKKCTVCTGR